MNAQMKYSIGNQVTNKLTHPGQVGTVIEIDLSKKLYPYRVEFAGRPAIWHGENELELHVEKQYQSMDISSGFGIGGAGSDDYNIHTETDSFAPQFSKRKSSGQLWQPCNRRGCNNEPVCLDCEYCDDHCQCGE